MLLQYYYSHIITVNNEINRKPLYYMRCPRVSLHYWFFFPKSPFWGFFHESQKRRS